MDILADLLAPFARIAGALTIPDLQARWFLPFVLPLCAAAILTDLRVMKITNRTTDLLGLVFLIVGIFLMPLPDYGWRLAHIAIVLMIGIVANAGGLMGAGDAKFLAAAAPYVPLADAKFVGFLFCGMLIGAVITQRTVKYTPLRRLAPDWESWTRGLDFPMGLVLGSTLGLYLILGAL